MTLSQRFYVFSGFKDSEIVLFAGEYFNLQLLKTVLSYIRARWKLIIQYSFKISGQYNEF